MTEKYIIFGQLKLCAMLFDSDFLTNCVENEVFNLEHGSYRFSILFVLFVVPMLLYFLLFNIRKKYMNISKFLIKV